MLMWDGVPLSSHGDQGEVCSLLRVPFLSIFISMQTYDFQVEGGGGTTGSTRVLLPRLIRGVVTCPGNFPKHYTTLELHVSKTEANSYYATDYTINEMKNNVNLKFFITAKHEALSLCSITTCNHLVIRNCKFTTAIQIFIQTYILDGKHCALIDIR